MGTENVACPHCGAQTWATVPSGHKLILVKSHYPFHQYSQDCTCSSCKKKFWVVTSPR